MFDCALDGVAKRASREFSHSSQTELGKTLPAGQGKFSWSRAADLTLSQPKPRLYRAPKFIFMTAKLDEVSLVKRRSLLGLSRLSSPRAGVHDPAPSPLASPKPSNDDALLVSSSKLSSSSLSAETASLSSSEPSLSLDSPGRKFLPALPKAISSSALLPTSQRVGRQGAPLPHPLEKSQSGPLPRVVKSPAAHPLSHSSSLPASAVSSGQPNANALLAAKLKDPAVFKQFHAFLRGQHAEEHLDFLSAVERFKEAAPEARPGLASALHETFIAEGAERQVNLPSKFVRSLPLFRRSPS